MSRPHLEVADIIRSAGADFIERNVPRNVNLMNGFVRHSQPNSPFSKSKDTLRNPIVARPRRPSKSYWGSESTSAIATLRAPRLPLPIDTSVESHLT
jgi:hypothetical protein